MQTPSLHYTSTESHTHTHTHSTHSHPQHPSSQKCLTLPKVKCAFHPSQTITNFCTCECCLLPLCPSCVKIHTIEHINMKKVNPQYEPITDLLEEIYGEVQELLGSGNEQYRRILEIDARVDSFRTTIQQKIGSVKQSILNQVQKYFAKLDEDLQSKIENMTYIKILRQYKQQSKRSIIGLKNIDKSFNPSNDKLMRIVIKYKGGQIRKQVQEFEAGLNEFLGQVNNNFVTFSVREDYRQLVHGYLDGIKKIEVSDVRSCEGVPNLASKLVEVYEKNSQESKKEIRKSIGNFLANSATKWPSNQQNNHPQHVSISSSIKKPSPSSSMHSQNFLSSNLGTPNTNKEQYRRSLSKGKGLSLMQINNTLNTTTILGGQGKGPRAVNICAPMEFHRTAIIRRDQ